MSKLSQLRALLNRRDDPEIDAICIDHFPVVYDKFARGMMRTEKINILLNYCRTRSVEFTRLRKLLGDILTITSPIYMELIRIPAGDFLMGSDPRVDPDAYNQEQPQHRLYLPEYYIAKTPVTNQQYAAFVEATGHREPDYAWENGRPVRSKLDHPVTGVAWHDAVAYCEWLSKQTGRSYGLPSEAEWEKAARGTDGRVYPWGNQKPDERRCNYNRNIGDTTPVGQYSPLGDSPYGCVDMAGNVWEWTRSLYRDYPYDPKDGREDMDAGDDGRRVLRGGAFYFSGRYMRCACRYVAPPYLRDLYIGFRLVCGVPHASGL